MSLLFSVVEVEAAARRESAEFLMAGIPRNQDDLEEWDTFMEFAEGLDAAQEITVHAEAYIYGEGETECAGLDEIEVLSERINAEENFLSKWCDDIEEVDFSFLWSPENRFGWEEMEI